MKGSRTKKTNHKICSVFPRIYSNKKKKPKLLTFNSLLVTISTSN